MTNPFEDLRLPTEEELQIEDVQGSFACQDDYCRNVAYKARYVARDSILTWRCLDGHISKIEGFNIG